MFRERARLFSILQYVTDLLLTCAAIPLAYVSRLNLASAVPDQLGELLNPELLPLPEYAWVFALGLAWWSVAAFALGLYRVSIRRLDRNKIWIAVESSILLGLFLGFLSFALRLNLSRPLIALFVVEQAALLSAARVVVGLHGRYGRHPNRDRRNVLIVGSGAKVRHMGDLVDQYRDWGLRVLGYVETNPLADRDIDARVLGTVAELPRIVEEHVVDELIFVANDSKGLDSFDEVLAVCKEQGIPARVAIDLFPAQVRKASMEFVENVPILTFSTTPDHAFALLVKRLMDIVGSAVLLVLLFPILLVVGLLVRLTSKGPAIYRQIRCGLYGRRFVLYKFRSMFDGAEDVLWEIRHLNEMEGPVFKMRNDPRVTGLGRFLRKSSIDELPQLWNVFKGDMSLVGPRAPLPEEVREYTRWQRRRLSVKPGITCLWQVSGRSEIDFHEWMKLDLQYIDNWSLLLDLKILLRTFPVVLMGKGAR
jgi:exopolysaccharide biosynthesis polyprenyl glycosylphosphotransferase